MSGAVGGAVAACMSLRNNNISNQRFMFKHAKKVYVPKFKQYEPVNAEEILLKEGLISQEDYNEIKNV